MHCWCLLLLPFSFKKNVFIILILQKEGEHTYSWTELLFLIFMFCMLSHVFLSCYRFSFFVLTVIVIDLLNLDKSESLWFSVP